MGGEKRGVMRDRKGRTMVRITGKRGGQKGGYLEKKKKRSMTRGGWKRRGERVDEKNPLFQYGAGVKCNLATMRHQCKKGAPGRAAGFAG